MLAKGKPIRPVQLPGHNLGRFDLSIEQWAVNSFDCLIKNKGNRVLGQQNGNVVVSIFLETFAEISLFIDGNESFRGEEMVIKWKCVLSL